MTESCGVRGMIALARIRGLADEKKWWGAGEAVALLDQLWFAYKRGQTDLGRDFPSIAAGLYDQAARAAWEESYAARARSLKKTFEWLCYSFRCNLARQECIFRPRSVREGDVVVDER